MNTRRELAFSFLRGLPAAIGRLDETYGTDDPRTIVIYRDDPADASVRFAIAASLLQLTDAGAAELVGADGGFGLIDTSILHAFPLAEVVHMTAETLVRQFKLGAAEFCRVHSGQEFPLYGVDDFELYQASLERFRAGDYFGVNQLEPRRAEAIVENLLARMLEYHVFNAAVTICGNLPDWVAETLRGREISFAVVSPQSNGAREWERYTEILKRQGPTDASSHANASAVNALSADASPPCRLCGHRCEGPFLEFADSMCLGAVCWFKNFQTALTTPATQPCFLCDARRAAAWYDTPLGPLCGVCQRLGLRAFGNVDDLNEEIRSQIPRRAVRWPRSRLPHAVARTPTIRSEPEQTAPDAVPTLIRINQPLGGGPAATWVDRAETASSSQDRMDCAVSPDGRQVALLDGANLQIHDAATGEPLSRITVVPDEFAIAWTCDYSPDGRLLATAGEDHCVRIWNAKTLEAVAVGQGHEKTIGGVRFTPDSRSVLTCAEDGTIRRWNAMSGKLEAILDAAVDQGVSGLAISPDGRRVAACVGDRLLRLWDAESGAPIRKHDCYVIPRGCGWSPDGSRLVSSHTDGTVDVRDASSGHLQLTVVQPPQAWGPCHFLSDGRHILAVGGDRAVRVWDAETGELRQLLTGYGETVRNCVEAPTDGSGRCAVISCSDDGTLRCHVLTYDADASFDGRNMSAVTWAGFLPGPRKILAAFASGILMQAAADEIPVWHADDALSDTARVCLASPDGWSLAVAEPGSALTLWDLRPDGARRTLSGHQGLVSCLAFSPDGAWLLSGGEHADRPELWLWNVRGEESPRSLHGHALGVSRCGFSPDGRWIFSAARYGDIILWDATTGEPVCAPAVWRSTTGLIDWSPDGRRIVIGIRGEEGRDEAAIYDPSTGEPLVELAPESGVLGSRFSPDGAVIATWGPDGSVLLWSVAAGQRLATFASHRAR